MTRVFVLETTDDPPRKWMTDVVDAIENEKETPQ